MTTYAIAVPFQGSNGRRVLRRTRLVIEGVPEDVTSTEVLEWIDDYQNWDSARAEEDWTPNMQRTAEDAPHIRWRGRPGRPEIGPQINVRLTPELLGALDAEADRRGESRAAAIRALLADALVVVSKQGTGD
jgi:Ribbon-helix-helix protein, copG family